MGHGICGADPGEGPQPRSALGAEEGVTLETLGVFIAVRNQREVENNEREERIFTSVSRRSSVLSLWPLRKSSHQFLLQPELAIEH